jgi:hypothetical protein
MLLDLHNNICGQILKRVPEIKTCMSYPRIRSELVAPACFIEIESFDVGTDPGTEELAVIANFNARLVIDKIAQNSSFVIRELALKLANLINKNTWHLAVLPAKIKEIAPDAFSPELDAYIVWNVVWTHELHVGKNIWVDLEQEIISHKIFINSEQAL